MRRWPVSASLTAHGAVAQRCQAAWRMVSFVDSQTPDAVKAAQRSELHQLVEVGAETDSVVAQSVRQLIDTGRLAAPSFAGGRRRCF